MINKSFNALVVSEGDSGKYEQVVCERTQPLAGIGDTLIEVHYSSLNYKDALSATGNKGVTNNYPHTPGIDAAGIVVSSKRTDLVPGDKVVVMGHDLGMNVSGGFSQYIRVPGDWVIKLPEGFSLRSSMIYGTAGITACLLINALSCCEELEGKKVIVSGSTGGVGSIAVAILAKLGSEVTALTRKEEEMERLKEYGAIEVIFPSTFEDKKDKLLLRPYWHYGVDTVGGTILDYMLKSLQSHGVVSCCGNIGGHRSNLSMYPFILNAVTLKGVDAAECCRKKREEMLKKLATDWNVALIEKNVSEITLYELPEAINKMLTGNHVGRTIVKLF